MTTPQKSEFRTSLSLELMCNASKTTMQSWNAAMYGPKTGYIRGLINIFQNEQNITSGDSSLLMPRSPMDVATISASACITSDLSQ